jgi:hypothetical protein
MLRRTMSDPSDTGHPGALRVLKLLLAVAVVATGAVFSIARFGDPRFMPDGVYRLAQGLKNPRIRPEVPVAWTRLCQAWAGWLGFLEREAPRLLSTEALWGDDDPLRSALQEFTGSCRQWHPYSVVPGSSGADLGTLALSPPATVLAELQIPAVASRVSDTGVRLQRLAIRLETWDRWKELRALHRALAARGLRETAARMAERLPASPGSPGYRLNLTRTVKHLDDLARDRDGLLLLATRWKEYLALAAGLEKAKDPALQALPATRLGQLRDQPTLRDFATSLEAPIAEMRQALDRAK